MDVPTFDDFLASKDVLYDADHGGHSATVVRIGKYVMKYNGRTRLDEADNLNYLTAYNIPVPKCYGSGTVPHSNGKKSYIIMDFVEGDMLEKLWPDLSAVDRDTILQQLYGQIVAYRSLPPPDYIGSVAKGRLGDGWFSYPVWAGKPELAGPFRDAQHFNEALATRLAAARDDTNKMAVWGAMLHEVFKDSRTVFTHTDIAQKNIIVQKQGTNEDGSGVFKVTIIDWEGSGWYPEWWEWCNAPFWRYYMHVEWGADVMKIMPVYAKEFFCWALVWDIIGNI